MPHTMRSRSKTSHMLVKRGAGRIGKGGPRTGLSTPLETRPLRLARDFLEFGWARTAQPEVGSCGGDEPIPLVRRTRMRRRQRGRRFLQAHDLMVRRQRTWLKG